MAANITVVNILLLYQREWEGTFIKFKKYRYLFLFTERQSYRVREGEREEKQKQKQKNKTSFYWFAPRMAITTRTELTQS